MMFSQKEFNLATSIIIVKRRSGMTPEQEVKQLFAARLVKLRNRAKFGIHYILRMDNTRAVKRYLRSIRMRMKKAVEVAVAVDQEEAKVEKPVLKVREFLY